MIYLDTSVALAVLLAEDRRPPDDLWQETVVSSRLLEFELWVRLHALGHAGSHGELARALLGRVALLELVEDILERARERFPIPVRTLDALHLASIVFLNDHGQHVTLATYDQRMLSAARALNLPLAVL